MRRDVSLALSLSLSRSLLFCCAFVCICLAFVWTRLALVWFGLCLLLLPLGPRAHWPCLAGSLACLFACLLACLMKSVREPANSLVRSGTPKNAQPSLVTTKLCLSSCPRAECYTTTSNKRRLQPASSRRQSASRRTTVLGCAAQPS